MNYLRIIFSVLLLSLVNAQSSTRPRTLNPATSMKPLASALHVLQPLSAVSSNLQPAQSTAIRTFELSVNDYVTVSINGGPGGSNVVASFKTGPGHGPSVITLQNYTYHVNWQPAKDQVGRTYSIVFAVAGLQLNAYRYAAVDRRDLPIKFYIESHPRIRARVMHAEGFGATAIAKQLQTEYQSPGTDVAFILVDEKFPALEIGAALHDVYKATPQEVADWLRDAGMGVVDIGQILKMVYALSATDTATVLRLAAYGADQVYLVLKQVYQLVREDAEDVLVAAGFSKDDAFKAILPDLLTWYDGLIHHYGPTVYEHPAELYKMSGIDWFLNQVSLQYEMGGQTYTYTSPATTTNLGAISASLKAAGATNMWLGTTNQFTEALKAGDQASAKARVHVVRLRDTGYTDFQFWLWYPYNGPGTFHMKAGIHTFFVDSENIEVGQNPGDYGNAHPLGEHYSDWENIVLRTDTKTGALIGAFMSEHGDYVPYLVATNGLLTNSSGAVIDFASLNGHANYPAPGDNSNVLKEFDYDGLKSFFSLGLEADLRNYTDYSPTWLNANSNYVIDGVDQYFIDSSRQVASNSWIAFDGQWGPVHPLNLTDSQKLGIVNNIAHSAVDQFRFPVIPRLAAEGCAIIAAPCAAFFGFGYFGCFAGCYGGLVTGVELAIDPLLSKYGPGLVDNFPADDQVLDGKPSPGLKHRGTEWQYMRYPGEQPPLVAVASPGDRIAGVVPVVINVNTNLTVPVTESYDMTVAKAELSINGSYIDVTASPTTNGGYVYYWDTTAVPDGRYELHARLTGTDGKFYQYSWDLPDVEVANNSLILNPLVLSTNSIVEGGSVSLAGSFFTSQTNQNISVSIDWGDSLVDSLTLTPAARSFNTNHTYLQDSPAGYIIRATISDGVTNSTGTIQMRVANVPPVITSLTSGQMLLPLAPTSATADFVASFSDPGTLDAHTAVWSFDEGTTNTVSNAISPLAQFHTYNAPGVYGVSLSVSDSGGGVAQSNLLNYLTVYDPAAPAYFAGNGTILAPVPTADTNNFTVQAPFGFILLPQTGGFALRFRLSDAEFVSTHYDDWQENAGSGGGQITGTGMLNGSNFTNGLPYNFVVTATSNTFQIQIATPLTNTVPYQSFTNQPLSGGSIILK